MHSNHSTLIICTIWLKISFLKILSSKKKKKRKKKKSSYDTSIVTLYLDTIVWPSQLKIPSSAIECRTVQLSYQVKKKYHLQYHLKKNIKSKKLISGFKRLLGEEPNNSETKLSNKSKKNKFHRTSDLIFAFSDFFFNNILQLLQLCHLFLLLLYQCCFISFFLLGYVRSVGFKHHKMHPNS